MAFSIHIKEEREMAESNVEKVLNHLQKVKQLSHFSAIWLQLRFLGTFLKFVAKGGYEYESLPFILTRIKNVGLPLICSRDQEVAKFDLAAAKVLEKLNHLQPDVERIYFFITQNSPTSRVSTCSSRITISSRDHEFLKFVSFIREDMRLLLHKRTDLPDVLKNQIDKLQGKLILIDGLLTVTSNIFPDHDRRHELFRHFQYIAVNASHLSYCCLANLMNKDRVNELVHQYSQLTMKIEPSTQNTRELYIQVLTVPWSGPGSYKGYFYPSRCFAESYLTALVHLTKDVLTINCGWPVYMKDQVETLLVELRLLECMAANNEGVCSYVFNKGYDSEVHIVIKAGRFLFSNYNKEMNEEAVRDVQLELTELLDNIKLLMLYFRNSIFRNMNRMHSPIPHFPRTDELDLAALKQFLDVISDNKHQNEQVEHIWRRVMRVTYEAEYTIDYFLLSDATLLSHVLSISEVIEKIKVIKAETKSIHFSNKTDMKDDSNEMDEREEPHAIANGSTDEETQLKTFKEDRQIVGFDEEETLVQFLLTKSEGTDIVFITGMAGQAKSTLGNVVFNNLSMTNNFDVCAWCTVSQVYDKRSILIKLIKMANGSEKNDGGVMSKSYDDLVMLLNQRLKKRKYLIFLDDIWEIRAWKDLKISFPESAGSKILFTARSKDLPSHVNGNCKVIQLQPLSPKKSMELLNMKVFGDGSCPSYLKDILDRIANRCKGLPLAIKLVAGILRGNNKYHLWNEVAHSPNSYILDDCKGILDLSYNRLPYNLKPCFLYFGSFPEDEVIASKKLLWLWMAEGFIRKTNEKSLERIGEDCLMGLINRNLITGNKRRSRGGIKEVSTHDLVRKYCLDRSEKENFLLLLDTSCNNISVTRTSYMDRRLAMHFDRRNTNWSKSVGYPVRTLLFSDPRRIVRITLTDVLSICRGFKLLRVLDLMCITLDGDLSSGVYTLIHLRYLAICGAFDRFSESISKLSNLETLLVRTTGKDGVRLPSSLLTMIKLRHLHIRNWFVFNKEITLLKLLENLENLQTISTALVPCGSVTEEVMKRCFKVKKLKFIFIESGSSSKHSVNLPVNDCLSEIESLNVSYRGNSKLRRRFDISFPKCIKKLTLSGFRLPWKKISVLEEVQNLQVLKLLHEAFEGTTWEVKDDMFPKVKFLKLEGLDIERWISSDECEDDSYFPSLEHLELRSCKQLQVIPSELGGFGCLKMIKVQWCRLMLLDSVMELKNEQNNLCNDELKVQVQHCR